MKSAVTLLGATLAIFGSAQAPTLRRREAEHHRDPSHHHPHPVTPPSNITLIFCEDDNCEVINPQVTVIAGCVTFPDDAQTFKWIGDLQQPQFYSGEHCDGYSEISGKGDCVGNPGHNKFLSMKTVPPYES